jgi:hypothetical protein
MNIPAHNQLKASPFFFIVYVIRIAPPLFDVNQKAKFARSRHHHVVVLTKLSEIHFSRATRVDAQKAIETICPQVASRDMAPMSADYGFHARSPSLIIRQARDIWLSRCQPAD